MKPVLKTERAQILDILRGFALLGICVANYPMFSLYIFQPPEVLKAMPTAGIDKWVAYFHFAFIDGKFYSLFSLLFGIGFSMILYRSGKAGQNGVLIFYRRLFVLLLIGLMHSLLLWEGDILVLYAITGALLPLFRNVSDRKLLACAAVLILFPVVMDTIKVLSENKLNISNPLKKIASSLDRDNGITDQNFSTWLIVNDSYSDLLRYNQSGIAWRYQGLLDNNRFFKVLGVFLLGLYTGRNMLYLKLEEKQALLKKIRSIGFTIGIPISLYYAWHELNGKRIPDPMALTGTVAYALSVVPLSLAYAASITLWYHKRKESSLLKLIAMPGRMALTNYLIQTVLGITIFYGIGFGLGAKTGAVYVVLIAIGVYILQVFLSKCWLHYFKFGPIEWIWRMLTYGKYLPIKKARVKEHDL